MTQTSYTNADSAWVIVAPDEEQGIYEPYAQHKRTGLTRKATPEELEEFDAYLRREQEAQP